MKQRSIGHRRPGSVLLGAGVMDEIARMQMRPIALASFMESGLHAFGAIWVRNRPRKPFQGVLDLEDPSCDYLDSQYNGEPGLGAEHEHTLAQLLAHLGCIPHYQSPNVPLFHMGRYDTALQAAFVSGGEDVIPLDDAVLEPESRDRVWAVVDPDPADEEAHIERC